MMNLRAFKSWVGLGLVVALSLFGLQLAAPASAQVACPEPSGNPRLIRYVYLNILNRCPDPAGVDYWTSQLDLGLNRKAFTLAIDDSDENVANNANDIYGFLLHRAPTPAEAQEVATIIRTTHQDGSLNARLLASDEYYAQVPGATPAEKDEAWLSATYQLVLDRDVDAASKPYWLGRLGSPSTEATRHSVSFFLEYSHEQATGFNPFSGWVHAVYFAALGRPSDPGGFDFWVDWLTGPVGNWQTFRMYTIFLASDEAYALAQTQPNPEPEPTIAEAQARFRNRH